MVQEKGKRGASSAKSDAPEINAKAQIKEYKETLIIDAAAKLFYEKGFQRTTIDDIAASLGFTKPFVYTYFTSKHSILERLFDRIYDQVLQSATNFDGPSHAHPEQRLRHFVYGYIRKNLEQPQFAAVLLEEEKNLSAEKLEYMRVKQHGFDDQLAQLIAECAEAVGSYIAEPKLAALSISGMVRCLHRWYSPEGRMTIEQVCEELTNISMRIAGVPPEPLSKRRARTSGASVQRRRFKTA
ncbi:TetR/AcrR family transcriptional regulator [Burkholderia multivorans]|uniref:TetR/AcrR family transcriptional regulator n=1 Tax=Burkholderia multivorans TaxID=87883 RepID=UPI001C2164DD|nr:TetR/AcrR family transcriptional regulator [Burkholderia multivorans]MBU9628055.1 TetR/AcrR family transcriptional regulator [Burkholderia multivorans]